MDLKKVFENWYDCDSILDHFYFPDKFIDLLHSLDGDSIDEEDAIKHNIQLKILPMDKILEQMPDDEKENFNELTYSRYQDREFIVCGVDLDDVQLPFKVFFNDSHTLVEWILYYTIDYILYDGVKYYPDGSIGELFTIEIQNANKFADLFVN